MLIGVRTDVWKREYPGWVSHLLKCLTVFAESPVVLSPLETLLIHEPETTMHREMEDEAGAGAYGKAQLDPPSSAPWFPDLGPVKRGQGTRPVVSTETKELVSR